MGRKKYYEWKVVPGIDTNTRLCRLGYRQRVEQRG